MRAFLAGGLLAIVLLLATRSWAGGGEPAAVSDSRLTTLYRHDPLRSVISLATGEDGHVLQDHRVLNRESDLDFGNYAADALTVGIEGHRVGALLDLGSSDELAARHHYEETVGGGQGYASLHYEGDRIVVARAAKGEFEPLAEARALLGEGRSSASAPVVVGHLYLARITDDTQPGFERVAKLLVVAHVPGESVTLRWTLLRN